MSDVVSKPSHTELWIKRDHNSDRQLYFDRLLATVGIHQSWIRVLITIDRLLQTRPR